MNGISALREYRKIGTQGAVVDSNPHQLILMLIDGAIEKTAAAAGKMLYGETAEKGRLIGGSIAIVDSLRASLDHEAGGELSLNLERLYDYMARRLLEGNLRNDGDALREVISLLKEIREAWSAIPQDIRGSGPARGEAAVAGFAQQ